MTYGKLKQKIYSLLDLNAESGVSNGDIYDSVTLAIGEAISSCARKIAAIQKCITKRQTLTFSADGEYFSAVLPADFIAVKSIYGGGKKCDEAQFCVAGNKIYTAYGICTADLFYSAFHGDMSSYTDVSVLEFDDFTSDTLAYGAAMELCSIAYPGDYNKYMTLSTEYDERMSGAVMAIRPGKRVSNSVFSGRRFI
ncbi:MAG: hypothetical protein KBS59_08470 [Clostridiales bacterium]|nr:hypothetical protein [Clostridiales bacterium]